MLVNAWPDLPEYIKSAVTEMVRDSRENLNPLARCPDAIACGAKS